MKESIFKYKIGTWLLLSYPTCEYHIEDNNFIIDKQTFTPTAFVIRAQHYFNSQVCYTIYNPTNHTTIDVTDSFIKKYFIRELYTKRYSHETFK